MKKLFFVLIALIAVFGCVQQTEEKSSNNLTEINSLKTELNQTKELLVNSFNYSFEDCFNVQLEKYSGMFLQEKKVIASEYCNEKFFGKILGIDSNCIEGTLLKATETGFATECSQS